MLYSLAVLVRKILFCHSKIKFISSCHRVIFTLYMMSIHEFHVLELRIEVNMWDPRYCLSSAKKHSGSFQSAILILVLRWLNRVMRDHEAHVSPINRE